MLKGDSRQIDCQIRERIIHNIAMIKDWAPLFEEVKKKDYSKSLHEFLEKEYRENVVYPPRDMIYNAFALTSPQNVKVVILGQDPYHGSGQAMGLSFSVPLGIALPPSLQNIYREIEDDLHIKMNFRKGDLTPWAEQGVLLLNAYLTVRGGEPLSHNREEYDHFFNDVMKYLDSLPQPIVFMLWGNFAKRYRPYIQNKNRLVLVSAHPSPMAANRGGWFKEHQFSQANDYLLAHDVEPIDWQIR